MLARVAGNVATALGVDVKLAVRNTIRQRRRSALALAAIACGVAALMLAAGFIDWNFLHYRESMIRSQFGHLQVHKAGFTERGASDPFAYLLPGNDETARSLARIPGFRSIAPRLTVSGLASREEVTLPFIAEGIDPQREASLSETLTFTEGRPFEPADPKGVVVGQGLAAALAVKPGDTIVLLANTRNGGVNAIEANVRGIFRTISKAYDDSALRMPIATARELVRTDGSDTWVVMLARTDATAAALRQAQASLGSAYEVVPWWRMSDFYNKSAELFAKQVSVMKFIIGLLIVLSITTTLMMTVMERTGEIGTAMALGATRGVVLRRFLVEGLVLGAIGAAAGVSLGWLLATVISAIGIPVPPPPGMAQGYIGGILVTPSRALEAATLAVGTTLLASAYPAWMASRFRIVDALRANR